MPSNSEAKNARIGRILRRIGIYSPERAAAIVLLDDTSTPSPLPSMAKLGFSMADGAPNGKLLAAISSYLERGPIDREARDTIQLSLREVGIAGKATADPGRGHFIANYWKSKSNNCVSVLTEEFRELLHAPDTTFEIELSRWTSNTEVRLARLKTAEARATLAQQGRLVPLTISAYCSDILHGYEVVFVDDADGDRIPEQYKEEVALYRIPLSIHTRWPDIVLRNPSSGTFWVVDAVESDGEVDYIRRNEIRDAFAAAGLVIDGYTTSYRSLDKFRSRQKAHDNIAEETFVWIAELGGSHWRKTRSLG